MTKIIKGTLAVLLVFAAAGGATSLLISCNSEKRIIDGMEEDANTIAAAMETIFSKCQNYKVAIAKQDGKQQKLTLLGIGGQCANNALAIELAVSPNNYFEVLRSGESGGKDYAICIWNENAPKGQKVLRIIVNNKREWAEACSYLGENMEFIESIKQSELEAERARKAAILDEIEKERREINRYRKYK